MVSSIRVFTDASELRNWVRQQKRDGKRIAFVPTMGYLHKGHLSLVRAAKGLADIVVASIYVNPTQFSANEDFDVYPRQPDIDRQKLESAGCVAVFEPESLYTKVDGQSSEGSNVVGRESSHPDSHETYVTVERLQLPLCGKARPHHFRGVATVVTKLFHIVEPDVAVFGRKDYQQFCLIQRMVRDLDFGLEVVGMPICREADGLAMSSRNARLSPEARAKALCISRALKWARQHVEQQGQQGGGAAPVGAIRDRVAADIQEAGGKLDYVELVDATSLLPVTDACAQPTLLAVAAHFDARDRGTVRLIDNTVLGQLDESLAAVGSS